EVAAVGTEAVQPDHAVPRRRAGFAFDGLEHGGSGVGCDGHYAVGRGGFRPLPAPNARDWSRPRETEGKAARQAALSPAAGRARSSLARTSTGGGDSSSGVQKIRRLRSHCPAARVDVSITIGIDSTRPRITGDIHAASAGEMLHAITAASTPRNVSPP